VTQIVSQIAKIICRISEPTVSHYAATRRIYGFSCLPFFSPQNAPLGLDAITCIVDDRVVDGELEYLVRSNNPLQRFDLWTKSINITCYQAILAYYHRGMPDECTPRPPDISESPLVPVPTTVLILGIENRNDALYVIFLGAGLGQRTILPIDEVRDRWPGELLKYFEALQILDDI
jgi:hypothetical protein